MRPDVRDLREFYDSPLGQVVRRLLRRRIRAWWPDLTGQRVLGLGYAVPLLSGLPDEAERVAAAMPAQQGAARWPREGPCRTVLVDELEFPFGDRIFDRALLIHALENAEQTRGLLREVWRVLADGGRLLVVVPNRIGVWAHYESTPFGHGRPYSPSQLARLLSDNLFTPQNAAAALHVPPARWPVVLRLALAVERFCDPWGEFAAGVVLAEAEKAVIAAPFEPVGERAGRAAYSTVPKPLTVRVNRAPRRRGGGST